MFNLTDRQSPMELMDELERFIEFWLGPRREEYGEPAEALNTLHLPGPLRRLYAFAGRWPSATGRDELCEKYGWVSIFAAQDKLLRPSRLEWSQGRVRFLVENQSVWSLTTSAEGEDAPVWMDERDMGIENCHEWPQVHDSLARFLTTFCLQELTFGSKFGVWDTDLTKYFQSGEPSITPILVNGRYVWEESCLNFYLMDDDVLVGDFSGAGIDDSFFFGANSDSGISRIQSLESPIVALTVTLPSQWTVSIQQDGSGDVGVYMEPASKAMFPPGTFDFESLRDEFLAGRLESAVSTTTLRVCFWRSGRGNATHEALSDEASVKQVVEAAIAAAVEKEPRFDICRQNTPLGE